MQVCMQSLVYESHMRALSKQPLYVCVPAYFKSTCAHPKEMPLLICQKEAALCLWGLLMKIQRTLTVLKHYPLRQKPYLYPTYEQQFRVYGLDAPTRSVRRTSIERTGKALQNPVQPKAPRKHPKPKNPKL